MRPRDAASAAVQDYLDLFIPRPTVEDEAIARCAIMSMIAPNQAPDLDELHAHKMHRGAVKRFVRRVGGDGLFLLTGVALEEMGYG